MKRRGAALLLAGGAVAGMGLATAVPASAAVYDEIYPCTDNGQSHPGYKIGSCDGVWWHDNTTKRTLRIHFTGVTHSLSSGYNNTPVDYVSKIDGDQAWLAFYCRNEKYNIRSYIGSIHLGGSDPYNHSWPGGWNPCTGNYTGMQIVASGSYGGVTSCTTVTVNTYYYQFAEKGYQNTYPNTGPC